MKKIKINKQELVSIGIGVAAGVATCFAIGPIGKGISALVKRVKGEKSEK